jgi:hypothetical protein
MKLQKNRPGAAVRMETEHVTGGKIQQLADAI